MRPGGVRTAARAGERTDSASGRTARADGQRESTPFIHNGVSDHGLHVIAVVMIAVSALSVLLTVADRHLMRTKSAGR